MRPSAGLISESEGAEPHRYVVVLPADEVEDEEVDDVDDAEDIGAEPVDEQA